MTEFRNQSLTDASFHNVDLSRARFRLVDLTGVSIRGSELRNVEISGALENVVINGVNVVPLIEAELNRRYPDRRKMRPVDAAGFRDAWVILERLWLQTVERARLLPPDLLHAHVDGEWSFIQTLRHLVFATDAWAGSAVLDLPMPYHRLGFPHSSYPPEDAAALGLDLAADPTFDEVLEVRADRMALVRGIVDGLTDAGLERQSMRAPAPGYPEESRSVRRCLDVVMREECEHHRYAVRDLKILEARNL